VQKYYHPLVFEEKDGEDSEGDEGSGGDDSDSADGDDDGAQLLHGGCGGVPRVD
jgi:hypothetical protein